MDSRSLGSTGLTVTRLGIGLAAIGRPAYITTDRAADLGPDRSVAALEARSHELLDAARGLGIRYLDAARSYGYAERFLASWLRGRDLHPGEVTVGSKWGYEYVGAWRLDADVHEVKDHSLAMLRRQLTESRGLLDPWLRLYQVHSATLDSGILDDREVLEALAGLRDEGLVVGMSTSGPRQGDTIRAALARDVGGGSPFASVQATWNLLEPSVAGALQEAHDAGWGVIVKEAVANGRLARPGEGYTALEDVAARHAVGVDAVAIAAVLANPWVDVALSGAATVDQLRSNVRALGLTLDASDLSALATLAEPPDRFWTERGARPWQ